MPRLAIPLLAIPLLVAPFLVAAGAQAHPHVFVDSRIEVVTEGGAVTGVRLTWTYDEYFSLVLSEDLGIDGDGDGVLSDAEAEALAAEVTDWPSDYAGDLVVTQGGEELPLGERREAGATMADGRITETHLRLLATPAVGPLAVQNFDPGHYVAYTVAEATAPTGCEAAVTPADLDAAYAEVEAMYGALDVANAPADVALPPVGYAFADTVTVACGG